MQQRRGRCTLEPLCGGHEVPAETQRRERLDGGSPAWWRHVLPALCAKVRRAGWAQECKSPVPSGVHQGAYYSARRDGRDYLHSTPLPCPGCVQRPEAQGEGHFRHPVGSATLVTAGAHRVLPLEVEAVRNRDGQDQQECAINAAKRRLLRLRPDHPQLLLLVGGEDRYGPEPCIAPWCDLRLHHVLVCKPTSHVALSAGVEDLERLGGCEQGQWQEGPACRRRCYPSRLARAVPLTAARRLWGTCVEVWAHDREGQQLSHHAWCTDLAVTADNGAALGGIGRSRWQSENEHCNVHKNQGDALEHHYGHGQQTLSRVFYLRNLLACIAHGILERGDRLSQRCVATTARRALWHTRRTARRMILVSAWADFLLISWDDAGRGPSGAAVQAGTA